MRNGSRAERDKSGMRRRGMWAAAAVLVLVVLAGCSNAPAPPASAASAPPATTAAATTTPKPQPFDLIGSIELPAKGSSPGPSGVGCRGDGGYSDVRPGGSVTVHDATSKIIALGSITLGAPSGTGCQLFFEVKAVPPSAFYQIEVTNRGLVTFTEQQARGGEVMLTLGS